MSIKLSLAVGVGVLALGWPALAPADFILTFDKAAYTIDAPGQTVDVEVFVTQVAGGPQVGPGNGLATAAIRLAFNNPSGIAAIVGIAPNPAFDAASFSPPTPGATEATLALTSLSGLLLPGPLRLGTFTFTGLAAGTTALSVTDLDPGPSLDFSTINLDDLDARLVPGAATIAVRPSTFIPEPTTMVPNGLAILAAGLAFRLGRGRRAPVGLRPR